MLNDTLNVCTLIGGDFTIQTVVDPSFAVVSENLKKAIMTGWKIGMLEGGTRKLLLATGTPP